MEGSQAGPPPGPSPQRPTVPAELPDDQRPATLEDVKGLRRWVIVAGVWAVAATALAVIALLKPAEQDPDTAAAASRSVNRLQDRLDERFEQLDSRVGRLPRSSDVRRLGDRLQGIEARGGQAGEDAKAARDTIGRLQDRVEKVEQAQERQSRSSDGGGRSGGRDTSPQSSGGQPQN